MRLRALALMAVVASGWAGPGCVHALPGESEGKAAYEDRADARISAMERNVVELRRRAGATEGNAGQQLGAAADRLQQRVANARAELLALEARDAGSWLDEREGLEHGLAAMDAAYEDALGLMMAH